MPQQEGFSQDPVHQAVVQITVVDAVLPVDTAADWETTGPGTNKVAMAAANVTEYLNTAGYISLDDTNDEIDLRPGVYQVQLELVVKNSHASIDADFGVAVTNPAGTTVYHLSEDEYQLVADSGVRGQVISQTFLLNIPGSAGDATVPVIVQIAARTASATLELVASSQITIRRFGNND